MAAPLVDDLAALSTTDDVRHDVHYGDDQPHHDGTPAQALSAGLSTPTIPSNQYPTSPNASPMTRTVAIIKTHALRHRFDIEKRIQEASFEIVKERQMEFDTETDPETLDELFGEDAASLAEGPVWVYVLERRRAVEVWSTLMGDRDPEIARQETPNSLRALYGITYERNGLMGAPDNHTAEIQIASLFVSSPPFTSTELPAEEDHTATAGTLEALSSSVYAALAGSETAYEPSEATSPSTANGGGTSTSYVGRRSSTASATTSHTNTNNKVPFKARPIPSTLDKPDIVPRTTKAAALRAGVPLEKIQQTSGPRAPVPKERLAQTFANVPGHKRTTTIAVASTAAPTIAPRMTRAASLRIGGVPPPANAPPMTKRAVTDDSEERGKHGRLSTFEGVPGHKRRESIAVASTKAPTVAPRLNKSAALRVQKDAAAAAAKPPSSFKAPTKPATVSRATSSSSITKSQDTPTAPIVPNPKTRPSLASTQAPPPSLHTRSSSVLGTTTSTTKLKPRPSSSMSMTSSTGAPTIAPRMNKSAALRAAKMEAEAAERERAASKAKAGRPSMARAPPPSSFKQIAI